MAIGENQLLKLRKLQLTICTLRSEACPYISKQGQIMLPLCGANGKLPDNCCDHMENVEFAVKQV